MKHIFYILILLFFTACDSKRDSPLLLDNSKDTATSIVPILDTLSNSISVNTTLTKNRTWILEGKVVVESGAILTIEAGTKILAKENSWLLISAGATINAVGLSDNPIVFDIQTPNTKWGGLTIVGNTFVNSKYEGDDISESSDTKVSSGTLEYVHINHSGLVIEKDKEINGLSLFGVTVNTIINNITINNSLDDGVEIWGGDVNLNHISINNVQDDGFDTDLGWTGTVNNLSINNAKDCAIEISGTAIAKYKNTKIKSNSKGVCFNGFNGENVGAEIRNLVIENNSLNASISVLGNFDNANSIFNNIELTGSDKNITANDATQLSQIQTLFDTQIKTPILEENISADITQDLNFTNKKIWNIRGIINIKSPAILTIEEGTIIKLDKNSKLNIEEGATLIANGSSSRHITFRSPTDSQGNALNKWEGISLNGNKTHTKNILNYVDIENGSLSLLNIYKPSIIQNITVSDANQTCVSILSGDVSITNINIERCEKNYLDIKNGYLGTIDQLFLQQYKGDYGVLISDTSKPIFKNFQILQNVLETTKVHNYQLLGGIYLNDTASGVELYNGTISDNVSNNSGAIHTNQVIDKNNIVFSQFTAKGTSTDNKFTGASSTLLDEIYAKQ